MGKATLRYLFLSSNAYHAEDAGGSSYAMRYPRAPYDEQSDEYLICGEGDLTEAEMNAHKAEFWFI